MLIMVVVVILVILAGMGWNYGLTLIGLTQIGLMRAEAENIKTLLV